MKLKVTCVLVLCLLALKPKADAQHVLPDLTKQPSTSKGKEIRTYSIDHQRDPRQKLSRLVQHYDGVSEVFQNP